MPPRFHATPRESIAETVRESVFIGDAVFHITRPADSDSLLDHPWVRSAIASDNYAPYWATLWPAARMLAKTMLRETWTPGTEVLDVGCGLGLAGIVALSCGLRVTFADVDATALSFAAANATQNGFSDFRTMPLDIRHPPEGRRYPIVIGSDLMYEDRMVDPLVDLLHAVLAPNGLCLVTDPDRQPARHFRWKLAEAGFDVIPSFVRAGDPKRGRVKGTLYRIRHTLHTNPK